MSNSGDEQQGTSFGSNAAGYTEHRPDYPREAIEWALVPVADRPQLTVLDLGAGTGQLTKGLRAAGIAVVAVEPDARMRDELVRNHPGVEAHIGSAESIPLPDASVDAVLAGNAFHWFDQEKAFPEIARVLRPGGVVAALWNDDDARVDWIAGLARIFGWDSTTSPTDRLRQHPLFTDLEHADFRHGQRCTTDSMVARMGTLSPVLALPEQERGELLGRIRRHLDEHPDTQKGEFDLPIRLTVTRAELRGAGE
ncbi:MULTISPECIES: class I SAM-dependent methyltransferase [unclassified Kitasatospora]|uniref:class I SAM-dependent methyltransferase n=1 Tax=unclassified Kitasatospora TaxID=2633591 RepID=UPI002475654F|nr:class I SAM-dependent methyltransferase [Kitasatospora sp. MAA19]MDH6707205.1 SAM-dependent methyltransferase [Kitasatospora sp. MAA19]